MNMTAVLAHIGLEPLVYGIVVFLGIALMWWKFTTGRWMALTIDIVVFVLVFKMHGGTMAGGMAAAVAALLAGLIFPLFLKGSK